MNYEALDEALRYLEGDDEVVNEMVVEAVLGSIIAAMIGALTVLGIIASKQNKTVKAVLEDPKAQTEFKKVFKEVQNGLKKDKNFSKYNEFLKYMNYNYHVVANGGASIYFDLVSIDVEKLFVSIYGKTPEEYTRKYSQEQPDNDKPAPKFKKACIDIKMAAKDFMRNIKSKTAGKFNSNIYMERSREDDLDIYYTQFTDMYGKPEDLTIGLELTFDFNKLRKTKTIDEE